MFEVHAVAPAIFQLEFMRKLGLHFTYGNQEKMRNVDEAVFSKVLGESVSDLRHSGWRLDEPGVGSGPCIWGTCALNRDKKTGMESQNLSLCLLFLCLN